MERERQRQTERERETDIDRGPASHWAFIQKINFWQRINNSTIKANENLTKKEYQ